MVDIDKTKNDFADLVKIYAAEIKNLKKDLMLQKLTKIQLEVIELLAQGKTTKEIAAEKKRSPETINNHKRNIFKKLNINKTAELVGIALESGLI